MSSFSVRSLRSFTGRFSLPGDKSIAHRAALLSALSSGTTLLRNYPLNKDCLTTLKVLEQLGIRITIKRRTGFQGDVSIVGAGLRGFKKPPASLYVGESGTTLRLIVGILAGQDFKVRLTAAQSLTKRPMRRVTEPLRMMGVEIEAAGAKKDAEVEEYPPLVIRGGDVRPIAYTLPIASAQVKSAILLAGLFVSGGTSVIEPVKTRDHTERMLKLFKAHIGRAGEKITIHGNIALCSPGRIRIPGDISSASFFIVLATLLPFSEVCIEHVSVNPSRLGIVKVLKKMGADIRIKPCGRLSFEPSGTIVIKYRPLRAVTVRKNEIPSLIDELPVLMVAAALAKGKSTFEGIDELRVKETDRIHSMKENLKKMGACVEIVHKRKLQSMRISGAKTLRGTSVRSYGDHRTAMSMIIAGLTATGRTVIDDVSCIDKSFPGFTGLIRKMRVKR